MLNCNNTDASESVHQRSDHSFIDVSAIGSNQTTDFEHFQSQQAHSSHSAGSQQSKKYLKPKYSLIGMEFILPTSI